MSTRLPVVDAHAHVLLPALAAEVARRAPEQWAVAQNLELARQGPDSLAASGAMIRTRFEQLTVLDRRIADMDDAGIDVQLVSPSPSHYYPWADAELSVWIAATANEAVAQLVAGRPDRLLGLGLVPLQQPDLLVSALEDAVLRHGLVGVEISSSAGDVELSDPRLEPFWGRAAELGAVLFLHPFGCTLDERLNRFYLSNTVGQPVENAVALSHLIFAGVLDRHPDLKILAAHGGGYLPTYIGRSDHAWSVRPESRTCQHVPSSYLSRLWFDSLVHDSAGLRNLVNAAGADRIVLGSDYPFDMGVSDPVERVRAADLGSDHEADILAGNIAALLSSSRRPSGVTP